MAFRIPPKFVKVLRLSLIVCSFIFIINALNGVVSVSETADITDLSHATKFMEKDTSQMVSEWRDYGKHLDLAVVDIMKMDKPKFDAHFRNPCFLEDTRLRCLPYFMVIGFQKCGTTDLYDKIVRHPQVHPADEKEPNWWNAWRLNGKSLTSYTESFSFTSEKLQKGDAFHITGEASVATIWDNHHWMYTPENKDFDEPKILTSHLIQHLLPNTRFIAILRNPVKRLYSDYNFYGGSKTSSIKPSPQDFHQQVVFAVSWLENCFRYINRKHCLFSPPSNNRSALPESYQRGRYWNAVARTRLGLYSEYLAEWNTVFSPNQTLVIRLEDYSADRLGTLNSVFDHLKIHTVSSEFETEINGKKNANIKKVQPMFNKTSLILEAFYGEYNKKLAQMQRDDRFLWLDYK